MEKLRIAIRSSEDSQHMLEEQKEELSLFAHFMNYDLRSNLMNMSLWLDLYEEDNDAEKLLKIKKQIGKVSNILQRSVQLADAGLIAEKSEPNNLVSMINEVLDITVPKEIGVIKPLIPNIYCDREKISQVFKNIFENAVLHGKPKQIMVEIMKDSNSLTLTISNDGIPIDNKRMENFNKYPVLKEINKAHLGLSIIKRIINAHKWEINLENKPYTKFNIVIPIDDIKI
jgi:signal transduction histidine kinase